MGVHRIDRLSQQLQKDFVKLSDQMSRMKDAVKENTKEVAQVNDEVERRKKIEVAAEAKEMLELQSGNKLVNSEPPAHKTLDEVMIFKRLNIL